MYSPPFGANSGPEKPDRHYSSCQSLSQSPASGRRYQFAGGVPVSGVDGAGFVVAGGIVSLFEGAAGVSGAGDAGGVAFSFELSLQAANPRKDAAAIDAIRNFFIMALLP
ncbi:hypothetical protein KUG47_10620 [Falsochrobactrum sp. TDYN1]|uniref:Uncharacterized protein n=1 Tax=Falsochrobactrum tianjinense TaxID=2706015 RepID=A0A949PMD0_9HYPH|nr:hypothetical protein [Falsochrobactrum sp. TDYN1]MBV2143946.1 hypothetical protein [Falsochrobactrum sp. TDYN1]